MGGAAGVVVGASPAGLGLLVPQVRRYAVKFDFIRGGGRNGKDPRLNTASGRRRRRQLDGGNGDEGRRQEDQGYSKFGRLSIGEDGKLMVGAVIGTRKEDKVRLEHLVMQVVDVVVIKSVTRTYPEFQKKKLFFCTNKYITIYSC